jgi:hypothetical protein
MLLPFISSASQDFCPCLYLGFFRFLGEYKASFCGFPSLNGAAFWQVKGEDHEQPVKGGFLVLFQGLILCQLRFFKFKILIFYRNH